MKIPTIEAKRRGNGGIFIVRYLYRGRREHYSLGTADEAEKDAMVEEIKYEIRRGIHQPRKKMLFENLLERFLQHQKARVVPTAYAQDLGCGNTLLRAFAGRRVDEIRHQDLEIFMERRKNGEYRSELSKKPKPSNVTINHEMKMMKHMFNQAVLWDMLPTNPLRLVRCLPVLAFRPRYATIDELTKIRDYSSPELWDMVVFELCTAFRPKEIFNLKWNDLDWPQRLITVTDPKNRKPRLIPMNNAVYAVLMQRLQHRFSEYVFPGINGKKRTSLRTAWNATCRRAGVTGLHFYDLRKTFCTVLASEGTDPRTLMDMSGHRDLQSIAPYLAFRTDKKRQALDILDRMLKEIGPKVDQIEVPDEGPT